MSHIVLRGVSKYYGTNKVLSDVDLEILESDFMALLGRPAAGKAPPCV